MAVSLSGTFETLPVAGVLGLLAGSRKSGALRLEADELQATVYMREGRCQAVEGAGHDGPCAHEDELESRLVDVCFEVARQDDGTFAFDAGAEPPYEAPLTIAVDGATAQLEELLEQWGSVKQVIPSLDHQPRLHATLSVEMVELDAERWKLVVAIDGRRTVRQIVQKLESRVIDVCRELVALIDVGAVRMSKTARAASFAEVEHEVDDAPVHSAASAPRSLIIPSRPYGPGVDDADPAEAARSEIPVPEPEAPLPEAPLPEPVRTLADPAPAVSEAYEVYDQDGRVVEEPGDTDDEPAAFDDTVLTDVAPEVDDDAGDAGGPFDGDEDRGDAEDVAAAVAALKERGELPADASPDEVRDRGALLRLFSALRDS